MSVFKIFMCISVLSAFVFIYKIKNILILDKDSTVVKAVTKRITMIFFITENFSYTTVFIGFIVSIIMTWYFIKSYYPQWFIEISHVSHAFISYSLVATYNEAVHENKLEMFSLMRKYIGVSNGDILEIGCGSGGSLKYYPKDILIKLTVVEPNSHCRKYLEKNLKQYENIELENYYVNCGENLKDIESNSVNLIICTFVLCSVTDQAMVLNEIKRVLKPGGKFYFMEHISAEKGTWLAFYQKMANNIWSCFFDGCNVNRNTITAIKNAGFREVHCQKFDALFNYILKVIKPHVMGHARK